MTRKKRLGRGLEALLNTTVEAVDSPVQSVPNLTSAAVTDPPKVVSKPPASVPVNVKQLDVVHSKDCLLYTSPSPRD